jgi:hypothetical protein
MYHTYRLSGRQRRLQTLEKLFRLNAVRWAVCSEGNLSTAPAPSRVYEPIPLPISKPVKDTLSALDIPLGQGRFARDYIVSLTTADPVVIELKSEKFDTFVSLLTADGTTVDENDDGPDGTTNSWLVVRVPSLAPILCGCKPLVKPRPLVLLPSLSRAFVLNQEIRGSVKVRCHQGQSQLKF